MRKKQQPKRPKGIYPKIENWCKNHPFISALIICFIGIIISVLLSQDTNKKIEDTKKKILVEIDSLQQQFYYKDAFNKIMITDYFNSASFPKLNEGIELSRNKKYQEAINSFTKLIKADTTFAEAYYHRGIAELEDSSYNAAIKDFNKAVHYKLTNSNVYFFRGLAYSYKKYYYEAIQDFKKGLSLKDDKPGVYYNLGISYFNLMQYDSAETYLEEGKERYPEYSDVAQFYNLIGLVYKNREDRDYNKAIEYFTEAINHDDDNIIFYSNRGNTYKLLSDIELKKGNSIKAKEYLNKAEQDFKKANELEKKK